VSAGTDPSGKLSGEANYTFGDYFDGSLQNLKLSLSIVPIPHIVLKGSFDHNNFQSVGEGDISRKVDLYTLESRFFLNPRVQFFGLYQRNTNNQSDAYNLRLAWEYNPLSYFYLVYNSRAVNGDLAVTREQQAIFKVSFLKQF